MYSGRDAANTAYPTQWALNPTAYQNVDTSHVDWAALAQQWIAMKEAAAIVAAPPPPTIRAEEEGEAPMEVENPDNNSDGPAGAEWNSATNSWSGTWNQWGMVTHSMINGTQHCSSTHAGVDQKYFIISYPYR